VIEQVGNALTFKVAFIASKLGKTGLTVTVNVYRNGTKIVDAASATEQGDGIYLYALSSGSVNAEGYYEAAFTTSDTTVDQRTVYDRWYVGKAGIEHLDADVSTRNATAPPSASSVADAVWDEAKSDHAAAGSTGQALAAAGSASDPLLNDVPGSYPSGSAGAILGSINSAAVTVVAPVSHTGRVTIVRGDTYSATDNRALRFSSASWPSLTGATVTLKAAKGEDTIQSSATIIAGSPQVVQVELTSTSDYEPGEYRYEIEAVKSGRTLTLATGTLTIKADI